MSYARDGFIIWRSVLPVHVVAQARAVAYEIYARTGGFGLSGSFEDGRGVRMHHLDVHRDVPAVAELVASPSVRLGTLSILGRLPAYVTHSKFSYKAPGAPQAWEPHQDAGYKPGPRSGFTFMAPLEPCDARNGTLELSPGSHAAGVRAHTRVGQQLRLEDFDGLFEPVVAAPGDLVAFDLRTVHRSGVSEGPGLRALLFFEVEPFSGSEVDDAGRPPVVVGAG